MAERQWTHDELQGLLEMGSSANLGKLIAEPGRKYRAEFARDDTLDALRNIAASDVLPDDIRALVQRVLVLYETASDPFLNLSTRKGRNSKASHVWVLRQWMQKRKRARTGAMTSRPSAT